MVNDASRRQAAMFRLSAAIAATHDEDEVYQSVVSGLHDEALGYDFLAVFLIDEETGDRVLRASVGWPDVPPDMRVHRGEGLSEQAVREHLEDIRHNVLLVAPDAQTELLEVVGAGWGRWPRGESSVIITPAPRAHPGRHPRTPAQGTPLVVPQRVGQRAAARPAQLESRALEGLGGHARAGAML